jgi:hypothetical protein
MAHVSIRIPKNDLVAIKKAANKIGVGVVNIDNGFGAASLAYAIVDTGRGLNHENTVS